MEWALLNYNGEFFPDPMVICRMVELKLESLAAEQDSREWNAWKASQAQAEQEGKLATEEDYAELRAFIKRIAFGTSADAGKDSGNTAVPSAQVSSALPVEPGK